GVLNGTIYIQVTRGAAPRTHRFPDPPATPNELIYVQPFIDRHAAQRRDGARVIVIEETRWKRCDIKSVNLLANCLGAEEAYQAGAIEAIFVEPDGRLAEGTHTSLFGVQGGSLLTAPLG